MSSSPTIKEVLGGHGKYFGFVYGVEIEAEGFGLPERETIYGEDGDDIIDHQDPDLGLWCTHEEGSISGAEYVMMQPLPIEDALAEIDCLFDKLKRDYGATLKESPRTSIHVHVNCADRSMQWLRKALPVLAAAEPFLIQHSGRHRKGNLFCLSRREAPFGWLPITNAMSANSLHQLDTKYMAINFVPLWSTGSIEFRMMRGLTTASQVKAWVSLLDTLMTAIDNIPDNHDWQHFPDELRFLALPCGLAEMPRAVMSRLEKQGLQSAQEIVASICLTRPVEKPRKKSASLSYHGCVDFETGPTTAATATPVAQNLGWNLEEFQQIYPNLNANFTIPAHWLDIPTAPYEDF